MSVDGFGKGVPSRVSSEGQVKRGSRCNAGREGTPMLTVTKNSQETPVAARSSGSTRRPRVVSPLVELETSKRSQRLIWDSFRPVVTFRC